jgi:hypothetical protein
MKTQFSVMTVRLASMGMGGLFSLAVLTAADTTAPAATPAPAPASVAAAPQPARISFAASEVLKLAHAKVNDDTIVAFVKQSTSAYSLTAEDIVYLRGEGITDRVLSAMLTAKPVGGSTAEIASAPAPTAITTSASSPAPGQTAYPGGATAQPTVTYVQSPPAVTYVESSPTVVYAPPVVGSYYYGAPYGYYGYYGSYGWGYPRPGISVSLGFGGGYRGGGYYHGGPVFRGGFHHR